MTPISEETRAGAWLRATEALLAHQERLYNLVVEIQKPGFATPQSKLVEENVKGFLKKYDCQPMHTVAETIFPATEYRSGGLKAVLKYPTTIYPFIKSMNANRRGTYALRLTQRACSDGSTFVPLEVAIKKLRSQLRQRAPKRAVYELDMGMEPLELKFYDYEKDHGNVRAGQCLSHVSLKLGPNRELYLTALYRYQYFLQKALGNFLGLARLQACIAEELKIPVGPLVCHATIAMAESSAVDRSVKWNRKALDAFVAKCRTLMPLETVALRSAA